MFERWLNLQSSMHIHFNIIMKNYVTLLNKTVSVLKLGITKYPCGNRFSLQNIEKLLAMDNMFIFHIQFKRKQILIASLHELPRKLGDFVPKIMSDCMISFKNVTI